MGLFITNPLGYKFRRQHPLGIYIADFFCYKLKLVFEVDGPVHDTEEERKKDYEREKRINTDGIRVIRFTNDEITMDMKKVIEKIKSILHEST